MNQTKVSVVICAYTIQRLRDIHEAVDSVLAQTLKPHEVVVAVDHNEGLFHRLKSELPPAVTLVLNSGSHKGSSATDNAGICVSTGDIVAFMDDDAMADRSWIENLVAPYREPSVIAVGGKLVPLWQHQCPKWFCEELDWIVGCTYKGHPEHRTEVRNLILCNASVRRRVFDAVGFFPSETGRSANWGTGFESQFFLRMKHSMQTGLVLYEPSAIVYHKVPPERATLKYLVRRCYNEGYHKAIIERDCAGLAQRPLSTEGSYLRYLLLRAIPGKMMYFYKPWALAQAGAIMIAMAATGAGYFKARVSA